MNLLPMPEIIEVFHTLQYNNWFSSLPNIQKKLEYTKYTQQTEIILVKLQTYWDDTHFTCCIKKPFRFILKNELNSK